VNALISKSFRTDCSTFRRIIRKNT